MEELKHMCPACGHWVVAEATPMPREMECPDCHHMGKHGWISEEGNFSERPLENWMK